ncbi:Fic family protein [Nitratidesulfovibrio termitidis]|uniref:Fic family protein n=1 Tax=Nitratidesulfovibrio termitidis TaxID=42252 RepID=UPI000A068F8E|nr:Fic family protein [Nitratidesulfovibrio termitidis]
MARTYEKSHPWLSFSVDMSRANHNVLMLLGEAQSKCEHIAGVPLKPDVEDELHRLYLAKGALATTAIEGNTLSEEQVLQQIEGKLDLPRSKEYLRQEVENIVNACNVVATRVLKGNSDCLTTQEICEFNKFVLKDLPLDVGVHPGEIRQHKVNVGRYIGAPPEDCTYLLDKTCEMLNDSRFSLGDEWTTASGILKSIVLHIYIAWIHPFGDGNGRTARLLELKTCIASGVPTPAAQLLSNHYNATRSEYYRKLTESTDRRCIFPFIEYALRGYVDQLAEQLSRIRDYQWTAMWINHVHEKFRNQPSKTATRRRRLVLDLTDVKKDDGWVGLNEIKTITTRIALEYANSTSKLVSRDINSLLEMNLIEKDGRRIRASKQSILAYLPERSPRCSISRLPNKAQNSDGKLDEHTPI